MRKSLGLMLPGLAVTLLAIGLVGCKARAPTPTPTPTAAIPAPAVATPTPTAQKLSYEGLIKGSGSAETRDEPVFDLYDTDQYGRTVFGSRRRVTAYMGEKTTVEFELRFNVTIDLSSQYPSPLEGVMVYSGATAMSNCGLASYQRAGDYEVSGTATLDRVNKLVYVKIDEPYLESWVIVRCSPAELPGHLVDYSLGVADPRVLAMKVLLNHPSLIFPLRGATFPLDGATTAFTGAFDYVSCKASDPTVTAYLGGEKIKRVNCGDFRWSGTAQLSPVEAGVITPIAKPVLTVKQYVPNKPEAEEAGTIAAKVVRDTPPFTALVPNENPDILFKDEERSGADRRMTRRLKEKLDVLAALVKAEWPGKKLRVTEAWDENGEHCVDTPSGKKCDVSLHYEGRAADINVTDATANPLNPPSAEDLEKLGRLAQLAVYAGLDWVFFENATDAPHVHVSVIKEP